MCAKRCEAQFKNNQINAPYFHIFSKQKMGIYAILNNAIDVSVQNSKHRATVHLVSEPPECTLKLS